MSVTDVSERAATPAAPDRPAFRPRATPRAPWLLGGLVVMGAGLRVAWALANGLSFDETFTAMAGRRPLGDLLTHLRQADSHPPLDYLIRMPLARSGASDWALRMPSLVFSVGALALFAYWMRDRGRVGILATAIMAFGAFQMVFGAEARMYALLELLGVAMAMVAESWLRTPRAWHAWAIGGLLFLAVTDHVSGYLAAAGLFTLAWLRRDREAWRWRIGVIAPVGLWLVLWGPSMLEQLGGHHSSWIPPTTIMGALNAIAAQVTCHEGIAVAVTAAVVAGAVMLFRADPRLGRVWLALGVVPFGLAATIGLFASFFLDRTLTLGSWAPALAVAYLADAAFRRSRAIGMVAALVVVLFVLPDTVSFIQAGWEYDTTADHLTQVVRAGDEIAVVPASYASFVEWRLGVRGTIPGTHVINDHSIPNSEALVFGHRRSGDRIWVLTFSGNVDPVASHGRCAPPWDDGTERVLCLLARQE